MPTSDLPATMDVRIVSSKLVKPLYEGSPPTSPLTIALNVFDKVTFNTLIPAIYAFKPPVSSTAIERGLAKALSEYRESAGRLGVDADGNPIIKLNDEGVRFIEATVDDTLDKFMPFKPTPLLLSLHPTIYGVEELMQVQLTRFTCGSLVVGFAGHHLVADGQAASNFFISWGLASRGLPMGSKPLHDRVTSFIPRDPLQIEFEHRGFEYTTMKPNKSNHNSSSEDNITVRKIHFTKDFLTSLKSKTSSAANQPFTSFECLMAHLWRLVTKSRGLAGHETTKLRISVNGRARLTPPVPTEFYGNLVLWAFPCSTVKELLSKPLHFAAGLIHEAVVRVNGDYFRSFIDFANSGAVEEEGLVPTADISKTVLSPDLEVDSWMRFPFYDLDFGGGSPFYFMPSYFPVEGMLFVVPSFIGDGSIDAYVPLFEDSLDCFNENCYSLV